MTSESKRKIQLLLVFAIAVAALRAGYVVYERHSERSEQSRPQAPPLNPDYYVVPKKLHPYDLKSAKQLIAATGMGEGGLSLHVLSL